MLVILCVPALRGLQKADILILEIRFYIYICTCAPIFRNLHVFTLPPSLSLNCLQLSICIAFLLTSMLLFFMLRNLLPNWDIGFCQAQISIYTLANMYLLTFGILKKCRCILLGADTFTIPILTRFYLLFTLMPSRSIYGAPHIIFYTFFSLSFYFRTFKTSLLSILVSY